MPDLDTQAGELVAQLASINAKIANLTDQADAIKGALREMAPGDYELGGKPALRIAPTRRFDVEAAAQQLGTDQIRQACLVVKYDPASVKRYLTPEQTESFMVEAGRPKVTLL